MPPAWRDSVSPGRGFEHLCFCPALARSGGGNTFALPAQEGEHAAPGFILFYLFFLSNSLHPYLLSHLGLETMRVSRVLEIPTSELGN